MGIIYRCGAYARHRLQAANAHSLHSPFLYHLYTEILAAEKYYYAFADIETLRRKLSQDHRYIIHGPAPGRPLPLSRVALMSVPAFKGRLLFKLANAFGGTQILELGTALGISSSYLAAGRPSAQLTTLEGGEDCARLARQHHMILGLENIKVIQGRFDILLPGVLESLSHIDLLYIDGHHEEQAALAYLGACLPHMTSKGLVVMDDIYHNPGMEKAWKQAVQLKSVTASVDLFHFGLLFFDTSLSKEHFVLKM